MMGWHTAADASPGMARAPALVLALASLAGVVAGVSPDANAGAGAEAMTLGVDYYPEQWPLSEMAGDMHAIKTDLGADTVRIGEFMWHHLEPSPGQFNFTLLDAILDAADTAGLRVMLGTPTATMPSWLPSLHPDVMTRGPDSPEGYSGLTPGFGGRRLYSFNSKTYRYYALRIVDKLAERYGQRPTVKFWQIDNEIGHEGSDLDFSDNSLADWRAWLVEKYANDTDALNDVWGTTFWDATYDSIAEVPLPRWTIPGTPARPNEAWRSNLSPGMLLDFRRFRRDTITNFTDSQVAILRKHGVVGQITTNAPGGTWSKALDFNDIFAAMDFPAYDNYPVWGGSLAAPAASTVAISLDVVRGWAIANNQTEKGWMVAEQLIGAQGHDIIGYTPRPGQAVAWAAATLAHGATHLLFFRYRAAVFGQEQFCYGVLDHTDDPGEGRKWIEAKATYALARTHAPLWLAPPRARVAVLYSTDNIFAWSAQPQADNFDFLNEAHRLYRPFWRNGVPVDVVSADRIASLYAEGGGLAYDEGALAYRVLVLPAPMLLADAVLETIERFVESGGSVWVGFRSDLKDTRGQMKRSPSRLATLAGVRVEEIESLNEGLSCSVQRADNASDTAQASVWREGLRIEATNETEALWVYTDSFFGAAGYAAVTRRRPRASSGREASGSVLYIATGIDPDALVSLATETLQEQRVEGAGVSASSPDLEQMMRTDASGKPWLVAINHGAVQATAADGTVLDPYQVHVVATQ